MQAGETVRFRESGGLRVGTVAEVFTAGTPEGTGITRERMRARLWFTEDGQTWETCRDLTDVQPVDGQLPLF